MLEAEPIYYSKVNIDMARKVFGVSTLAVVIARRRFPA